MQNLELNSAIWFVGILIVFWVVTLFAIALATARHERKKRKNEKVAVSAEEGETQ